MRRNLDTLDRQLPLWLDASDGRNQVRVASLPERQQIDATDVRVISPASAPLRPTWPPRPIIVAAAGATLGLLLSASVLAGLGYLSAFRLARSAAT